MFCAGFERFARKEQKVMFLARFARKEQKVMFLTTCTSQDSPEKNKK
jgi:hypothetical protein